MEVGIRDLKNNLSRYLSQVDKGRELVVTDRGRPFARISPINADRTIDRLIADGIVTPAKVRKGSAPVEQVYATEPVSPLVADQRR